MNRISNPKIQPNKNGEFAISIIIGAFLFLIYILGLFTPITSDAGKYAAISRVIYQTGDWINLSIHFEPYLQKPPLLFWITTPFYYLLGPSVFAFKLPVLLYSIITIYSTFRFTRLFYDTTVAKLAALMLVTCEFFFLFHNDIHTDVLLTANVIFAMWQLAEYFQSQRTANMIFAGLGIGLAMISKGPIGVFVPATATLAHLAYSRQLKDIFSYKILLGALVCLAILIVGLTGIFQQFGWEGLNFFFWENNAGRISGRIKGGNVDYFFYFHTTLYIFFPWGILFFLAWFFELKEFFKRKNAELFSLGAIIFYWIIISVAHAHAPHYFMVLSPFMAILSAKWLIRFFEDARYSGIQKTVRVIQYVLITAMWGLIFVLSLYCFPTRKIWFWGALIVLAGINLIPVKKDKLRTIVRQSVVAMLAFGFTANAHLFPEVFKYQSVIPACNVFNEQAKQDEMLNTYLSQHRELFFYAKTPGYFLDDVAELTHCLSTQTQGWIYTNDQGLQDIKAAAAEVQIKTEVVASFKHRSLSGLTPGFINPATRESRLKNMHLVRFNQNK